MFTTSAYAVRTLVGAVGTVIFAGACLLGATAPAQAAEAPRTSVVSYSDLNLASDHGRTVLDARIKLAARNVCANGAGDLRSKADEARCTRTAVEAAQPKKVATIADFKG
jgi:UrcA family protein